MSPTRVCCGVTTPCDTVTFQRSTTIANLTALLLASQLGRVDIVRALLDGGADVNAKRNDGLTALMTASQSGLVDFVQALIAKGADVNAKDNNDLTALMVTRNAKIRAVLVGAGQLTNQFGNTTVLPMSTSCGDRNVL